MTCLDYPKPTILMLLVTLSLLPPWQMAEAAEAESSRHSLIHRPQVQTTSVTKRVPSPANPNSMTPPAASPPQLQPLHRKILRRPAMPARPIAQASPSGSTTSARPAPVPTNGQPIPDDDAPDPELEPAPQE